jgi:hypothetical protein
LLRNQSLQRQSKEAATGDPEHQKLHSPRSRLFVADATNGISEVVVVATEFCRPVATTIRFNPNPKLKLPFIAVRVLLIILEISSKLYPSSTSRRSYCSLSTDHGLNLNSKTLRHFLVINSKEDLLKTF